MTVLKWPDDKPHALAVRLDLPDSFSFNKVPLRLGPGECAVFRPSGRAPIVVRKDTADLSFEIDGVMSGMLQFFYDKVFRGEGWLVRTVERPLMWGTACPPVVRPDVHCRAHAKLTYRIEDPVAFVAGYLAALDVFDIDREIKNRATAAFALVAARRLAVEDGDPESWASLADELRRHANSEDGSLGTTIVSFRFEFLQLVLGDLENGQVIGGYKTAQPTATTATPKPKLKRKMGKTPKPARVPTEPLAQPEEILRVSKALVGTLLASRAIILDDGVAREDVETVLANEMGCAAIPLDASSAHRVWRVLGGIDGIRVAIARPDLELVARTVLGSV